jgi:hypothetical protein
LDAQVFATPTKELETAASSTPEMNCGYVAVAVGAIDVRGRGRGLRELPSETFDEAA